MTVKELIEQLKNFDPDRRVAFSYDYGDHWRSEVAEDPTEVALKECVWSGYHDMYKVVDEGDIDRDEDEVKKLVVIS